MNDVLIAKKSSLERCVAQVARYRALQTGIPFEQDILLQDAISMNIQRACELAIDMANILIRSRKLGIPQSSRESFEILARERLISTDLATKMMNMVGFRNVLVHRYQDLDPAILLSVIQSGLFDLIDFAQVALVAGTK